MNSDKPIFMQIIQMIEDDILAGTYQIDDLIISTPQISKLLSVNPTTAQKAIGILTDRGIIYKKRGVGMAVTDAARGLILSERRAEFLQSGINDFIAASRKIGIKDDELLSLIKQKMEE